MPSRTLSDRLIAPLRRIAARELPQTDAQLLGNFVRHRDPAAFEAIVRRHGPMVYGVCRRVVGHAPDADDAFQAVFVVLARRAAAVTPREKLADFLFGVAYRTALKAKGRLARRRTREKQVDAMPDVAAPSPDAWSDLHPVIDQELAGLPDKLRLPVLLCDLEGRTQREAAAHLKLPPATLATRLAAARRKLADRLTARGITLAGGAVAAVLTANAAKAVPTELVGRASGAGLAAAGLGSGVVPANVLELSDGVLRMIATNKLKVVTAVLLACGLLAAGGVGVVRAADPPAAKPALGPTLDDKQFLTKTCETLRGSTPTPAEMTYFLADKDDAKRKKVVAWLTEPEVTLVTTDLSLNALASRYLRVQQPEGMLVWNAETGVRRLDNTSFIPARREYLVQDDATFVTETEKVNPPVTYETTFVEVADERLSVNVNLAAETDEAFLNRVIEAARGSKPTRIEKEYFLADKDAKKREKLLDSLLGDPAFAKKVGPDWKQTMLNPPKRFVVVADMRDTGWADKLIDDLTAKKKTDEQILESLSLAATGRLPTDTEKKLTGTLIGQAKDKKAAWRQVAGTLAGTDEAKAHAERLKPNTNVLKVRARLMDAQPTPLTVEVKPDTPKK